jgi:TonB family protein
LRLKRVFFFAAIPLCSICLSSVPTTSLATSQSQSPLFGEVLQSLATQILQKAGKVGCHIGDCSILVTNFVLPDGHTSPGGLQLADALAAQLSQSAKTSAVIDRSQFESFLQKERLSSELQSEEPVACWLARELNADAVIVGKTSIRKNNYIDLSVHLLNAKEEKKKAVSLKASLPIDPPHVDLSPTDGLPRLPFLADNLNGEEVHRANTQGVGSPTCSYTPDPEYTDEARAVHFNGKVVLEGVVGADGKIHALRIVNGAPYGLNEVTLKTVQTWSCTPAELKGNPVPSVATIAVSFASLSGKSPVRAGNTLLPVCSSHPQPHYTKEAKAAKFQGSVHVEATLAVDGKIENIRILDSPGLGLDEAVQRTLAKWKCKPAIVRGKPVSLTFRVNFNFHLH